MVTCDEDVSKNWYVQCFEYNKGILVGGPFDRSEHSVLFFPGDYPEGHVLSRENREVYHVFSKNFPEGAVYHWNKEKGEWHYVSQMNEEDQDGAKKLLGIFGVEPAPPL